MTPGQWAEIFAALDEAGVPEDFLADRDQRPPEERDWNWDLKDSTESWETGKDPGDRAGHQAW